MGKPTSLISMAKNNPSLGSLALVRRLRCDGGMYRYIELRIAKMGMGGWAGWMGWDGMDGKQANLKYEDVHKYFYLSIVLKIQNSELTHPASN